MKISQRLQQINQMVLGEYDHIWDCCCDHGLLGMLLLQRQAAPTVHFVDCVEPIMTKLMVALARFFPEQQAKSTSKAQASMPCDALHDNRDKQQQSCWQVHCQDVAALPLDLYGKEAKHLIIIAGVGGELLVQLVDAIVRAHRHFDLEFILCPVHHNYFVRESLAELGLSLKSELLLEENRRFYEILHLTNIQPQDEEALQDALIMPAGSHMWRNLSLNASAKAKAYLEQTIHHYQRIPENKLTQSQRIVESYQAVLAEVTGKGSVN
ncbi:tRNA (adenine(22)-N(1))-methyltransferase TrmK [Shewanella acanthi]|uniref:tRNA (adenine(22)-N(1))-methyltransferase TrmK n=1 Tax=Shewanella acanthi TaxID=2864212 RepID=UPI001C657A49|nr:tRNA (adenine(22)-N(1))-methyltransferase TrmK [Shewanella acanthi]QYJ77365.1 tRNA (adenine(22)-N(1))-methyltransferase TrmK [Shewanella acanthi]